MPSQNHVPEQVALWMTSMSFGAQAIGCSTGPWEILGVDPDMMYVHIHILYLQQTKIKPSQVTAGYHGKKSDVVHVNSHERFSSEQLLGNIHY